MQADLKFGLKENWQQFSLLVLINAFVGAMVGVERSIFPQFAESYFGLTSQTAMLSFIMAFGLAKAFANYYTGRLANRWGRKNLLVIGWFVALPVPFILLSAEFWSVVVFANVLLGISQGLTWSSTVVMKIDLVGEKERGLAMGFNEFAGYLAVGLMAFLSAYIAATYGIRPYVFYLAIVVAIMGLGLSYAFVKDTRQFVQQEQPHSTQKQLSQIFLETSFRHKTLSSVTQAGLVNNLNDGMVWGLLPVLLLSRGFSDENIGIITAIYPMVWGLGQLFTGKMADIFPKKQMLFGGMLLQGIAILLLPYQISFYPLALLSLALGLGTALVYPTFLASIAQVTSPAQRAESLGVFRFWRDLGYAFGALSSGLIADAFGLNYAIMAIAMLTLLSALVIRLRMPEFT